MLKSQGCTVVVITHRTSVLPVVDRMLVLADGQVRLFGPRDEVMARLRGVAAQPVEGQAGAVAPIAAGAAS